LGKRTARRPRRGPLADHRRDGGHYRGRQLHRLDAPRTLAAAPGRETRRPTQPDTQSRPLAGGVLARRVDVPVPANLHRHDDAHFLGRPRRFRALLLLLRPCPLGSGRLGPKDSIARPALPPRADRAGHSGHAALPGGTGIGELGFGALYKWLGASVACGVLGSLVMRIINWCLGIGGFFVYRRLRIALPTAENNGVEQSAVPVEEAVAISS